MAGSGGIALNFFECGKFSLVFAKVQNFSGSSFESNGFCPTNPLYSHPHPPVKCAAPGE
jgi:hypothetical protein